MYFENKYIFMHLVKNHKYLYRLKQSYEKP